MCLFVFHVKKNGKQSALSERFPRPLEQNSKQYIYVLREKSRIAQWLLFHSSEDIMEFSFMFQITFLLQLLWKKIKPKIKTIFLIIII